MQSLQIGKLGQFFSMQGCRSVIIAKFHPLQLGHLVQIQFHHNGEECVNVVVIGRLYCPDVLVAEIV